MPVALVPRMRTTTNPDVWTRFEAMLTGMHAGDVITVGEVVADTGIGVEAAAVVLVERLASGGGQGRETPVKLKLAFNFVGPA